MHIYIFNCIEFVYDITIVPQAISYKVSFERIKSLLNLSTTVSLCRHKCNKYLFWILYTAVILFLTNVNNFIVIKQLNSCLNPPYFSPGKVKGSKELYNAFLMTEKPKHRVYLKYSLASNSSGTILGYCKMLKCMFNFLKLFINTNRHNWAKPAWN